LCPEKAGVGGSTPSRGTILDYNSAQSAARAVGKKLVSAVPQRHPSQQLSPEYNWHLGKKGNNKKKMSTN